MFTSATLKLTTWYLVILIIISVIFSFIIFELSTSEISNRLERLQIRAEGSSRTITLPGPLTLTDIRENQTEEARASIFIGLLYMNLAVIGLGGVGSFLLARATLRPIEEAHEAQSRFTADASHELRTPLAIMKSEIQVALKEEDLKKNDYRHLLESNLEEVDKLTVLSQSLLQLSRMEHGLTERNDQIDVTESIKTAARSLTISPDRVRYKFPTNHVVIDGNRMIIEDLFRILLDNAHKYSTTGSLIDVALVSDGRTCTITISNDGPGIEKTDIHKVFDRFFRIEKSRSAIASVAGYGLGLSLAKHIVAIHDGTIDVVSEPGKMTTFTVRLPHIRRNR